MPIPRTPATHRVQATHRLGINSGTQNYPFGVSMDGVLGDYLDFGRSVNYVMGNAQGGIHFFWNETTANHTGYVLTLDEGDGQDFIELFFQNGVLTIVNTIAGVQKFLTTIGIANQFLGNHHYQITWNIASFQVFMDGNITPVLTVAGSHVQHFTNPYLTVGESVDFPGQATGKGTVTQLALFGAKLTGADENAYYYSGTIPVGRAHAWNFAQGTGDVLQTFSSGGGHDGILTGSGTVWVALALFIPRTSIQIAAPAIGTATFLNYANTLGYFPSQSFVINDSSSLVGSPATAQQTVTDYTLMVGGTWSIPMAGVTLIEGIDWFVSFDNDTTAESLANALNDAAGSTVATTVGSVINYNVPGDLNGVDINFDQMGLTPANTTFTGGVDGQRISVGMSDFIFSDVFDYQSFDSPLTAAQAFVDYVNNNSAFYTASNVGTTVTISDVQRGTNHNGVAFTKTPSDSPDLTLNGSTLTGGSGNAPILVGTYPATAPDLMNDVIPWTSNATAANSMAAYFAANSPFTSTYAAGNVVNFVYNVAGLSGNGVGITHTGSQSDLATVNFAGGVASNGTISRTQVF